MSEIGTFRLVVCSCNQFRKIASPLLGPLSHPACALAQPTIAFGLPPNADLIHGSPFTQFCPYLTRGIFPVTGLSGDKFKFNERGDGPARYNIIHYKQVRPGRYEWVKVGFFNDDQIEMNMSGEEITVLSTGWPITSQTCAGLTQTCNLRYPACSVGSYQPTSH